MAERESMIDWTMPRWITGEGEMEEARQHEAAGDGRVLDDGHPPAVWLPKGKLNLDDLKKSAKV